MTQYHLDKLSTFWSVVFFRLRHTRGNLVDDSPWTLSHGNYLYFQERYLNIISNRQEKLDLVAFPSSFVLVMIRLEESDRPDSPLGRTGLGHTRYLKLEIPENPNEVDMGASMLNHGNAKNDVGLSV